ncbi:coiled-coil domain-containing protein 63 [Ambystoma mexicanum]|uniref:coiled-coil domain-containing protein 63 n=1 Tax=Ambystoma mexicanum TaxID=8296 RepID=UPI0037E71458
MQSYSKKRSAAKEREIEMQTENELRKVQQHFRIMEESRKSYNDKTQHLLEYQRKEFTELNQEHGDLTFAINLTASPRNTAKDAQNVVELKELLESKDRYDALIREQRALIALLDAQISEMEEAIIKQKTVMSMSKSAEETMKRKKRIRTLEHQLNLTTINFDTVLSKNAKLRDLIEDYRRQRASFSSYYRRLLRELNQQKDIMTIAIDESTVAFEQSTEAEARIAAMKERRAKDIAIFNIELTELIRNLEHEKKLKEFMKIKSSERLEFGEAEIRRKREARAEEKARKAKGDLFESYQTVYNQLVKPSGHEDADALIAEFTEQEERNFASFTYLNEMHNEVDRLYERIKNVENELTNLQSDQRQTNVDTLAGLKVLEDKLQKSMEEVHHYEREYKESSKGLDQLMLSIEHLFKTIECDPKVIEELLGGTEGITHANMMLYFSIIEEKANELLRVEALVRYKESEDPDGADTALNPFLGGAAFLKTVPSVKVGLPAVAGDDDLDDFDETVAPYESDSLRKKVLHDVMKKEQGKDLEARRAESKHARRRAVLSD